MKKVFLFSLTLCLGMMGFAQKNADFFERQNNPKGLMPAEKYQIKAFGAEKADPMSFENVAPIVSNPSEMTRANSDYSEWKTMTSKYDLQTNASLSNRMLQWPDGSASVTATWSATSLFNDRGTGYNYYNPTTGSFGSQVSSRVESEKSGWPTIAPLGANGEILFSHTGNGTNYFFRTTKGTGTWNGPYALPNPNYTALGCIGTPEPTWPRVVTTGDNNQYVHVVTAGQFTAEGSSTITSQYVFYSRGIYQGDTIAWDPAMIVPGTSVIENGVMDSTSVYSADSYVLASNGNKATILLVDNWSDLYYLETTDNGATWTKHTIWEFPVIDEELTSFTQVWYDMTDSIDSIWIPNQGAGMTIGNDGTVHVVFTLGFVNLVPDGYYSRWYGLGIDGVCYWNSTMPIITSPDGDNRNALNPYDAFLQYDETGTTIVDTLWLGLVFRPHTEAFLVGGYAIDDENWESGVDQFDNDAISNYYGHMGCADYPAICIDANNNFIVAFSEYSIFRVANNLALRNCYVSYYKASVDSLYFNRYNMCEDWTHQMDECWYINSAPNTHNNEFWFSYAVDYQIGNYVNSTNDGYENPQTTPTDNFIYAIKLIPTAGESVNIIEQVSPLTSVTVAPNPIEGNTINVFVNASFESEASVAIYNLAGQMIHNQAIDALSVGINQRNITVDNLTSGIYFCTVTTANGFQETMKIVVK